MLTHTTHHCQSADQMSWQSYDDNIYQDQSWVCSIYWKIQSIRKRESRFHTDLKSLYITIQHSQAVDQIIGLSIP